MPLAKDIPRALLALLISTSFPNARLSNTSFQVGTFYMLFLETFLEAPNKLFHIQTPGTKGEPINFMDVKMLWIFHLSLFCPHICSIRSHWLLGRKCII